MFPVTWSQSIVSGKHDPCSSQKTCSDNQAFTSLVLGLVRHPLWFPSKLINSDWAKAEQKLEIISCTIPNFYSDIMLLCKLFGQKMGSLESAGLTCSPRKLALETSSAIRDTNDTKDSIYSIISLDPPNEHNPEPLITGMRTQATESWLNSHRSQPLYEEQSFRKQMIKMSSSYVKPLKWNIKWSGTFPTQRSNWWNLSKYYFWKYSQPVTGTTPIQKSFNTTSPQWANQKMSSTAGRKVHAAKQIWKIFPKAQKRATNSKAKDQWINCEIETVSLVVLNVYIVRELNQTISGVLASPQRASKLSGYLGNSFEILQVPVYSWYGNTSLSKFENRL